MLSNITNGALGTSSRILGTRDSTYVYCAWILTVYSDLRDIDGETQSTDDIVLNVEENFRVACYKVNTFTVAVEP